MALYDKIRIMNPEQAAEWAEQNRDQLEDLDDKTRQMLEKKLNRANEPVPQAPDDPDAAATPPQTTGAPHPALVDKPKPPAGLKRLICNKHPDRWILVGAKEVRFRRGEFITSDPELIDAICNEPDFGLWILAEDPELRKRYKRRR
jgi:hypothetical protein